MRKLSSVIALVFSLCSGVSAGDVEDGFAAYNKGDFATALAKLKGPAAQGDADAQFLLAVMYENGRGIAEDYTQAMLWYKKSAVQGDERAQLHLGYMYAKGLGVAQDYKQAMIWYERAATQGQAMAQYNLAVMYYKGQWVAQDFVQAHKWLSLSGLRDQENSKMDLETLEKKMTPQQILEAERLATEWMEGAQEVAVRMN
jgi:TPR repeat protein